MEKLAIANFVCPPPTRLKSPLFILLVCWWGCEFVKRNKSWHAFRSHFSSWRCASPRWLLPLILATASPGKTTGGTLEHSGSVEIGLLAFQLEPPSNTSMRAITTCSQQPGTPTKSVLTCKELSVAALSLTFHWRIFVWFVGFISPIDFDTLLFCRNGAIQICDSTQGNTCQETFQTPGNYYRVSTRTGDCQLGLRLAFRVAYFCSASTLHVSLFGFAFLAIFKALFWLLMSSWNGSSCNRDKEFFFWFHSKFFFLYMIVSTRTFLDTLVFSRTNDSGRARYRREGRGVYLPREAWSWSLARRWATANTQHHPLRQRRHVSTIGRSNSLHFV